MTNNVIYTLLSYCIAAIWLINGLFCKVFNLVPRHEQIVASIMGIEHARLLTFGIGIAETGMAIWIISRFKSRLNAVLQILIIGVMNMLEFILVPELLLWGKANALFAFMLILVILFNEFCLNKKPGQAV